MRCITSGPGASADVQDQRCRDAIGELEMQVAQVSPVVTGADQIAATVVGQRQRVRFRFDLGDPKLNGHFLQSFQTEPGFIGIFGRHQEEVLQPEAAITQRPWAHRFASDGDLIPELLPEYSDRVEDAFRVGVGQKGRMGS